MSSQGSDNRLCIFEFNTFISPGSVSYLQLQQIKTTTGAWVPLKSLSQGTQGLWNLYTVSEDKNNQYKVAKEIVELIHVEGVTHTFQEPFQLVTWLCLAVQRKLLKMKF